MQSEDGFHMEDFPERGFAKHTGATGTFLTGLEDQQYIALQSLLVIQPAGQFQENRHMTVVTAGMHSARMGGGKRQVGILRNGQRITVCPEGNSAGSTEIKVGQQRAFHGEKQPAVQLRQCLIQICHGLRQLQFQLRDPVERLSISGDLHSITSLR